MHALLLRLLPASFRSEYGSEMRAIHDRRLREASGPLAAAFVRLQTAADVLGTALRVHAELLAQDVRYALRSFRNAPGFTATAAVVAALGVGATTAAFSVTDHVLVRPLPFREPERLVKLWQDQAARGYSRMELSPANYRDWKSAATSFESMAVWANTSVNVSGDGEPERLDATALSSELLPLLGVAPLVGRAFTAEDDLAQAPCTTLLSHGLWQDRFGGEPVLGRRLRLNDVPCEIIGVMPAGFRFPNRDARLWTATRFDAQAYEDRANTYVYGIGRLRPGVTLDQARAEMSVIAARLAAAHPENAQTGATLVRMRDEVAPQARLLLKALFGASLCVLLIACTNLASLLLARALVRRQELAVRAALGAGRDRLLRQLLTESLLLALVGGALGVALAFTATPLVARLVPTTLPIAETPTVDWRVLAFAAVTTLAIAIGFGVAPAWRALRTVDSAGLREGARSGVGGRRERMRAALVTAEVTLSVVLLVSAGLLIRALWRVQAVDPGFRTDHILTVRTTLPTPKYQETAKRHRFYQEVLAGVRALPGVEDAAYTSFLPMVMRGGIWRVEQPGQPPNTGDGTSVSLRFVTPRYFDTLGIPLRAGRDVADSDTVNAPFVAVVSESLARRVWPGQDPLGRRFQLAFFERTIVGVVADVRVRGVERESEPQVYLPNQQVPDGGVIFYAPKDLAIRAAVDPASLAPAVRRVVAQADPEQPISNVRTMDDIVAAETGARTAQVRVLGAFAAVALLLAGVGIHGLLAFVVRSRSQEIGVRVALGATPRDVLALVLGQALRLTAAGLALGLGLAYAAGRTMEALLAGVRPYDAATFALAVGVCALMGAAGSLLPARRALRVDPIAVMRAQ